MKAIAIVWFILFFNYQYCTAQAENNQAPVILSFTADRTQLHMGEEVFLSCTAVDPEGENLLYEWETDAGEFYVGGWGRRPITNTDNSVNWFADSIGSHWVSCTVIDPQGAKTTETIQLVYSTLADFDSCLVVSFDDGILFIDFDGKVLDTIRSSYRSGVEVYHDSLFVCGFNNEIAQIDREGNIDRLCTYHGNTNFTILPHSRYASYDIQNEFISIYNFAEDSVFTISLPDGCRPIAGVVSDNNLIVGTTDSNRLLKIELESLTVSLFSADYSILFSVGYYLTFTAITAANGDFYVAGKKEILGLYKTSDYNPEVICRGIVGEKITGLAAAGNYLYATVNPTNRIYKIDPLTRQYETFMEGIDYPTDIAVWHRPASSNTVNAPIVEEQSPLKIYPNPAVNSVILQLKEPGSYRYEITTINGKFISGGKINEPECEIDLSAFDKGIYLITVRSNDFVKTGKLLQR